MKLKDESSRGLVTPEQLAVRSQRGSVEAFGQLVEMFEARLFNFLLRRVGNRADAEDLTQEAFLRAWTRIKSYRPKWKFSTWLYTIAMRLAISHARRGTGPLKLGESEGPARTDPVSSDEPGTIWRLVDQVLSEEQRTAVWLRYVEDMAIGEIATVLGKSDVGVRVMLFRARTELVKHLGSMQSGAESKREAEAPAPVIKTGAGRPVAGGVR